MRNEISAGMPIVALCVRVRIPKVLMLNLIYFGGPSAFYAVHTDISAYEMSVNKTYFIGLYLTVKCDSTIGLYTVKNKCEKLKLKVLNLIPQICKNFPKFSIGLGGHAVIIRRACADVDVYWQAGGDMRCHWWRCCLLAVLLEMCLMFQCLHLFKKDSSWHVVVHCVLCSHSAWHSTVQLRCWWRLFGAVHRPPSYRLSHYCDSAFWHSAFQTLYSALWHPTFWLLPDEENLQNGCLSFPQKYVSECDPMQNCCRWTHVICPCYLAGIHIPLQCLSAAFLCWVQGCNRDLIALDPDIQFSIHDETETFPQ